MLNLKPGVLFLEYVKKSFSFPLMKLGRCSTIIRRWQLKPVSVNPLMALGGFYQYPVPF
jgi:hypothetical protein